MKDCRAGSLCVDDALLVALACALAACDTALACPACRDFVFPPPYSAAWLGLAALLVCARNVRALPRCPNRFLRASPCPLPAWHIVAGAICCDRFARARASSAPRALAASVDPSAPPVDDDGHLREPAPPRRNASQHGRDARRLATRAPPGRRAASHASGCAHGARACRTPGRPLPCRVLLRLLPLAATATAPPTSPCAGHGPRDGSLTRAAQAYRATAHQHHDGRGRQRESFRLRAERSCARHRSLHWR
ncbi:hypothetical protein WJ32_00170 [Burkholderia ubonensis]|uniref:Uncharacterized protein n=1 Tax=Burkholderia ubonensis TaxID=101571 RepID=A0A118HM80_9BURK|nr:hypothetical protein [Burkholderia ubonensis]AOJ61032.1 hypothetical protein WJ32_00170 [Burkholderia ubonensis]KVG57409.1 hypothetical protein WJ33_34830 [Burkholderia ubonensis]